MPPQLRNGLLVTASLRRRAAPPSPRRAFVAPLIGLAWLVACGSPEAPLRKETALQGEKMGTTWNVKVVTSPLSPAEQAGLKERIEAALERVDASMSHYRQDSELSLFNAASDDEPFAVSAGLLEVVALADEISRMSSGAFDITIAPLISAWGFGSSPAADHAPTAPQIQALLEQCGHDLLEVDRESSSLLKRHPNLTINLSAIAKGYAVDTVAEALEAEGVAAYLIELGGELRVQGDNIDGKPWRVAIEVPQSGPREFQRVIALRRGAVATSGEYRNFRVVDGERVSHTIDPRTGRSIQHRLASVTVIDPSCARADALATALNVLGPEDAWKLSLEHEIAALLQVATDDGLEERTTPAFERRLDTNR